MAAITLKPQQAQRLPLVGGLFRRLFFHHFFLVTIPILGLGLLLVRIAETAINQTLEADSQQIAVQARGRIQRFVGDVEKQLRTVAIGLEMAAMNLESLEEVEQTSDRFLNVAKSDRAMDAFRHLYAVDTLRTLLATTDFSATGLPAEGSTAADSVLAGSELAAQELLPTEPGENPSVIMAVPLRSSFGEIVGALVGEVDAMGIWSVVDEIQKEEALGYAFLVNHEGRALAHGDKSVVLNPDTDYSELESVKSALQGETGIVDRENTPYQQGVDMKAAFAPISSASLNWALVIHRPVSEVEEHVNRMRLQILVVILAGIALALISTLVYTRRLVTPIGALVDGANRLSQGDLQYKIPVAGHDELGTLATEFNLMAEQLSQIQQQLRRVEHLDTIAKFSSVVAHEIRNPLNAMQINLHLLREHLQESEHEYLDVISGEIHRLENLVREFQTISRPPSLSPQETDMNELLTDIVNLQKGTATTQGIEVVTDLDHDLPLVEIDRNRLTQAILNVVLNAIQSMKSGGQMMVRTRREAEAEAGITIEVSDTGEGIAPEDLPHVFDFYYTSRDSGSGLGLSVAHQIVFEHGGEITLESTKGEGTTVMIALPLSLPAVSPSTDSAP